MLHSAPLNEGYFPLRNDICCVEEILTSEEIVLLKVFITFKGVLDARNSSLQELT